MRYKKHELNNFICNLDNSNQIVINMIKSNKEISSTSLSDCQNVAIEIGTFLETKKENTKNIVAKLEIYCEYIYQQSLCLNDIKKCENICEKIHDLLIEINQEIENIISIDKIEIVFLPYKASMWDSMESIWIAASNDERCNTYVIPIPYFEKNNNGSLGEMYYEGGLYPKEVPIYNWKEYNLEEHHPDIIYIHNPYDEYNYATTIHPDFYSKKLKKYTDMLVYVPYFVGINEKVEEHFCLLPGVFNSNMVIVESKIVRRIYIDELMKFEKVNNCVGVLGNIKKKIMALGSPKFDWIIKLDKEKQIIPKEWKGLIFSEKGKRKKVVLYNTTIDALLKNSETIVMETKASLNKFRENENIVLLWRPHPLLLTTIKAMRPTIYDEYIQMINLYKSELWGIYDDTPELERAIILADAYFGDWSSLVSIFRNAKKPILIKQYNNFSELAPNDGNVI